MRTCCWWGCKIAQDFLKTVGQLLTKQVVCSSYMIQDCSGLCSWVLIQGGWERMSPQKPAHECLGELYNIATQTGSSQGVLQ